MSVFPRSPCTQFYHFFFASSHPCSVLSPARTEGSFLEHCPQATIATLPTQKAGGVLGHVSPPAPPDQRPILTNDWQWGSVKDKVPSAGTLAEVVPYSTPPAFLSFFPTPSLTSPGSWFLISHLHINPHLKVCFWGSWSKTVSILDKRDVARSPSSWRPCGWAYFQSRPWKPKWMWW